MRFSGHRLLRNLKLQKINSLKKLKINYLLIGIVTLLLAAALWPSIPWSGKPENRVAGIIARGELRISTINSPMTFATMNNKAFGLDYELAKQFADYLGVTLKITVRQNISQLFDDLDDGQADMLAAGLVYNQERVKNYQAGPTYYSVSQQLVYRVGNTRPRTLAALTAEQLTIAPGHVAINDLQTLKAEKYPDLAWRVDEKRGTTALMQAVIDGKLDYTIADSVAVSLFQRVHPELAVALDITDEQPVTWFSARDDDNSLSAAMLDFFNNINEDGTLARPRRNTSATATISIMSIPAPSCARWKIFFRRCSRCLKNTPARLTGACWPPSPGRNPTGIRRPPPLPACAV